MIPATAPSRVDPRRTLPLLDVASTRQLELRALARLPTGTLMQRAGLAVARLGLALAPHARQVWIAAGPGNNGGDGIEAAIHLKRWGLSPVVTWLGAPGRVPEDTQAAWRRACEAGIDFRDQPPTDLAPRDLVIDALLGIGGARAPEGLMAQWIGAINRSAANVLAVDLPTGLDADTGSAAADATVQATATLSLLALKPGLFMHQGRDHAGSIWFDPLGIEIDREPSAWLNGEPPALPRSHASHKGSHGDVAVLGGESVAHRGLGMGGAATLAAMAALRGGAGRVLLAFLSDTAPETLEAQPELMLRTPDTLPVDSATVVCGCGGGDRVRSALPKVLSQAPALVLDADALNAIAQDVQLQSLLIRRTARGRATVITPHPMEAARLLACRAAEVQADRLGAAAELTQRFGAIVALKGSGTVIAAPDRTPHVNPTGNARLACAGTGDVLAGLIGARLAEGRSAMDATCAAVWQQGRIADGWAGPGTLTAGGLARRIAV